MSTVPLRPAEEKNVLAVRQFVDWVDARFEKAEDDNKTFGAIELNDWTVVVARRHTGERLQEFVEVELNGWIDVPRNDGKRAA